MKKAEEAIETAVFDTDHEMQAHYGMREAEYKPAFLYVERGPGAGQLLEVKQGVVVIGRASVSDLRIQHPSISRRHAQIKRLGEQFFVKDLSSQNGTFVNKQRLASEIEIKFGDSLALGNALVRLRGPMSKGEKLAPAAAADKSFKARQHTSVVARTQGAVTDVRRARTSNVIKIAVFAGAVGFGLAATLALGLVKLMTTQPVAASPSLEASAPGVTDRERMIQDAISRKMNEQRAAPAPPSSADEPPLAMPRAEKSAPLVLMPRAPSPAVVHAPAAVRSRPSNDAPEEDEAMATSPGGTKRTQVLAPYERGNAEVALELAKKAGDRELTDKLSKFIQLFDSANDAMVNGNGTLAIANFHKALALDEMLSSGWGKYGGEIRRHLGNLYTLVGLQYLSNGDDEKAQKAFESALKHDPNNARARQNLEKLSSAANLGDEDDAQPASRKVITPKKKSQSIDDAFGD